MDATPGARGDWLRVGLAVLLALIAVPWIFALLGFYAPDPIYADEPSPDEPIAAVHLGGHPRVLRCAHRARPASL